MNSSPLIDQLINAFRCLPGVGPKSGQRMTLHLLERNREGGKKLTKVSPNKTISGSIGSFCFSLAPPLLFYIFDQSEYFYSFNNFLLCLQISLVCQLGDIFISYIKRKAKVKDTGNFLPGHGGLLDRIDGIIFAIPYVWIYLNGLSGLFEMWIGALSRL